MNSLLLIIFPALGKDKKKTCSLGTLCIDTIRLWKMNCFLRLPDYYLIVYLNIHDFIQHTIIESAPCGRDSAKLIINNLLQFPRKPEIILIFSRIF